MERNVVLNSCLLAMLLAGCATSSKAKQNTASIINYILPVTQVTVGLDLLITKCDAPAEVKGAMTLIPSGVASPYAQHHLRVNGTALASFWKKHDLMIELYPNGAIKSVNGAVSDQTGAILVGALKIAATLGGVVAMDGSKIQCNEPTRTAFEEAKQLRAIITRLRKEQAQEKDVVEA